MRLFICLLLLAPTVHLCAQEPCNVSVLITPPTCPDDADAAITVVTNTPGQYTFNWEHAPGLNAATAAGLSAGPYTVTVTDTSGCVSQIDTVIVPPVVQDLGSLTATQNISCAGMSDGTVTLTVNPGPYTWEWTDDPTIASMTRTGLPAGVYVVLINGGPCPNWLFATLGEPAVTIGGNTTYCPSEPPLLSADPQWGFEPNLWVWSTGDSTATFTVPVGLEGPVTVTATDTTIGCTATEDILLTLLPAPNVSFFAPDSLCQRSPGTAILIQSNADSLAWQWGNDGFSTEQFPTITFNEPGWQPISLIGYDALGCGSAPVMDSVFVRPRFPASFTLEQVPCTPGIEVKFASDADSCAFFVGNHLVLDQCKGTFQVDLEHYAEYDFTFYSTRPDRCDDTASVHIDVRTAPTAFLPNAFTPNNDGINDTWPGELDIPGLNYQVAIFDRWGHGLWSATDPLQKWDGANLPTGVYVYRITMRDPCDPTSDLERNGFINLLR
ncbi:MAG: gliding motility-associated C-terminal domain-containing protein [Flavobacteriales bacterium]|nr:gliding motility-associated C-terminal domain-containing protein [Flavobacteriales bacterium]